MNLIYSKVLFCQQPLVQNASLLNLTVETHFRVNAYFKILDAVIVNMEKRFSIESLQMASTVDNFLKLNTNESKFFIEHYQVCTI